MPQSTPTTSADGPSGESRSRILDAAEELMAERGVDAVSLREINTAAGQRNASGVQYHFLNREGLLRALVARHMIQVDAQRNELLDALEAEGRADDLHALITALVQPLSARLSMQSGRRYLRIIHQLADRRAASGDGESFENVNRSVQRVSRHLSAKVRDLGPRLRAERTVQVTSFLLRALADQARRLDEHERSRATMSNELFAANLIDVLIGVVTAPVSDDTRRLTRR